MTFLRRSTTFLLFALLLTGLVSAPDAARAQTGDVGYYPHNHGAPGELPSPFPDRIMLTWSDDPATSLSVTWRTDPSVTESMAQVAIALAEPSFYTRGQSVRATTEFVDLSNIRHEHVKANYHSATFTGLHPDTLYAYRVGDGTHWSEWFHARTASAEAEPMSFLYFGDAQNSIRSHWSRAIRAAYAKAPDALFTIHAGDLIGDAHSNLQWGEWHQAGSFIHSMLPGMPVPGNHEYDAHTEAEDDLDIEHLSAHWRPGFTLPANGPTGFKESAYYLDIQGVRFIGLNSEPATEDEQALAVQTAWLDSLLTNNPNRWTIPVFHHPIFSSGEGRDNPMLRAAWKPLFDEHRVDIVLQGHDHTYARGRTVNVPEGVNVRSPIGGTMYVNSVSGGKMYSISPGRWENYYGSVEMERGAENTQLFQVIQIDGDTLRFHAFTVTGELYDAFDLVKRTDGEPNEFIARIPEGTPERTHENTVPYARMGEGLEDNEMEGMVERVGSGFVEIGGTRYVISDSTLFEDGDVTSLREGIVIEIVFERNSGGEFVAEEVEFDVSDRDIHSISGAVTAIEEAGGKTFVVVGGTKHEIVGTTEFIGVDGVGDLVADRSSAAVDYRLNEMGDGYEAVRVELGEDLNHGHDH